MQSPKGHEIQKVTGDADAIGSRGHAIQTLGDNMQKAANTLKLLADDKLGKGMSIDSLRDTAGEVHGDLKKAGERYSPSGTILVGYASAVTTAKSVLDAIVEDCTDLYQKATQKDGEVVDARTKPKPPQGSGDDDPVTTAQDDADAAWKAFHERAADYDAPYETWEDAYEKAVHGLQKVNDDGVHDSFWDDIAPALEILKVILDVAGIVLLVLALVIGGPIIAVIATVVAVIAVAVTIGLMMSGRAGWKDLALAVVGIIPFAKFGKLASLAKLGRVGQEASQGARFTRLSGTFNILRSRNFTNTARIMRNINTEARTSWDSMVGTMHLWPQVTGGTKAIWLTRTATLYARAHGFQNIVSSRSMLFQRLAGIDNLSTAGLPERLGGLATADGALFQVVDAVNGWTGGD